ncbi:MAG: hypothetical protein V3S69_01190, partial [Dehalococcoidales bacterium]
EFIDRSDTDTTLTVAGNYAHITSGTFQGYYRVVLPTSIAMTDTRWARNSNGDIIYENAAVYFEMWDGNGWGDDNKFTVLSNEATETDDNGNTIVVGQKRIELLNFIGDAE